MEIIHPPIDNIQRKEQEKSPYVGRRQAEAIGHQPCLDHPVFPPTGFTSMFSVDTSFQAGCGLISCYNAIFKNTLKIDYNFKLVVWTIILFQADQKVLYIRSNYSHTHREGILQG
jgi:hypothetical protein